MKKELLTTIAVLSFWAEPHVSWASKAVENLDKTNPALIEQRLLEQKPVLPQSTQVTIPSQTSKGVTSVPKGAEKVTFFLKRLQFSGGTIFSDSQLQEWALPYVKKTISLAQLYKLADQVTRYYREAGYLFSYAIIPPQKISAQGVAKIQLVEGYVDEIVYEGEIDALSDRARCLADKVKESRPLNAKALERYLMLLKDLPGLEVEAILKPSPTRSQASTLVLVVKKKVVDGSLGVNNFGSKFTGPITTSAVLGINAPWGWDDQWTLSYTTTGNPREIKNGQLGYIKTLNTEGTKLNFTANITETRPGDYLAPLNIKGSSRSAKIDIHHPFVRSRGKSIIAGMSFSAKNVKSGLLGNLVQSRDKLRIVGCDLSWDQADAWSGVNLIRTELTHGLKGLKSTRNTDPQKSRRFGRPDFTKINVDYSRIQGLIGHFSLLIAAESQYAFNPLLSPERFSYGGTALFRGYTDSPLTGDSGVRERLELRYGQSTSQAALVSAYQVYGFWGMGTAWNKKPAASERKRTSASEGGFGARLGMTKGLQATLEYVRPFKRYIGGIKNPTSLFAGLTCKF